MSAQVREAGPQDVDAILAIINHYAVRGVILPRDRADVLKSLPHFLVADRNGTVVGIVSRHDYGAHLKEVRSLAVADTERRGGIGTLLVTGLVERLRRDFPDAKIFVLTAVPAFFTRLGFCAVEKSTLPERLPLLRPPGQLRRNGVDAFERPWHHAAMRRTRSIDKRDYGRLKTVNLKVDYRIKGSETPTTVEVINLSTGGLCFLRNTIINKGEFIQVRFPFKTRKVIMNAQVVRIDGREVGVKFTDSEKEIERFINAFNEEYPSIRTQESADGDRVFGETYQRLKGMRTEKEPKP